MIIKIAEYIAKENEIQTILAAIKEFVSAIRTNEPKTSYQAFQKGKASEFIHLMRIL